MQHKVELFIGLDLTDPFARHRRPAARAVLDALMNCILDEWEYDVRGYGILPHFLSSKPFILAIDGPQGLSGNEHKIRSADRALATAGKSGYFFTSPCKPYAGFIKGSVLLFYSLFQMRQFSLYGLENSEIPANLLEVYPGAAWHEIGGNKMPKKRLLAGRQARYSVLSDKGIKFDRKFSFEAPPTHDELDAALAAYVACLFTAGKTLAYGEKPFEDRQAGAIREGYIIQPA